MTRQIVITRCADGGFHILEMGIGEAGIGETLREHDIKPEISADLAAKYLFNLLRNLVLLEAS